MSVLIRRHCTECDYDPPTLPAADFAIFVTDREEDERRRAGQALPVVLHPLTPFVLDEFGLSYQRAAWGGQLINQTNYVCRDCGTVFEHRKLTAGGVTIGCGGCLLVGVLVFVVGLMVAFATGNPFIGSGVGVSLGVLVATGTELTAHWVIRWRYPERVQAVDSPALACPTCQGERVLPLVRAVGQTFLCPRCGQRGQQFTPVRT
jgi:hypothetical protein